MTHEDCAKFAQDFGTVLDVEDLIPGAEYTLEVSSPGLERKLSRAEDYVRFAGSLVKLQTFTPVKEQGSGIKEQGGIRKDQGQGWESALAGTIGEVCGWSVDAGFVGGEEEDREQGTGIREQEGQEEAGRNG